VQCEILIDPVEGQYSIRGIIYIYIYRYRYIEHTNTFLCVVTKTCICSGSVFSAIHKYRQRFTNFLIF
jgi:hypothetical protein